MYLEEAVNAVQLSPRVDTELLSKRAIGSIIEIAIWALYERTKNRSFKFSIGLVPFSIKISKIRPLLVWWIGEPQGF